MRRASTDGRIPELDGLRGLAILSVLIWHYIVCQLRYPAIDSTAYKIQKILALTWSGVDLFFVISGFLIGGILLDNRGATRYLRTFFLRRVCRILPLYFLVLGSFALATALAPHLGTRFPYKWLFADPMPLWSYVPFLQNFWMMGAQDFGARWLGVTWSLTIEEQFYLILPFLILITPVRKLPFLLVPLILLAPVLRAAFHQQQSMQGAFMGYLLMPCRADSLLLGVLCAFIVRHERARSFLAGHLWGIYGGMAILALVLAGQIFFHPRTSIFKLIFDFGMFSYGLSVLSLFYACLLLVAILDEKGPVSRFACLPLLRRLGIISYGVYLYHQIVSGLAHSLLLQQFPRIETARDVLVTAGAFAVTLGVAALSWEFFEKPFVRKGHSFKYDTRLAREMPVP